MKSSCLCVWIAINEITQSKIQNQKYLLVSFSKLFGSSGLSGVISSNRDKNVPTIVVCASQTADRRDIPVPLLKFQILLPHLSLKSQISLLKGELGCLFDLNPQVDTHESSFRFLPPLAKGG